MARPIDPEFAPYDSVLFLALWWSGGRSYTLADILGVCDWIDRSTPTAGELDRGLNRLLAAGLVRERRGHFYFPERVRRALDEFRRRRRRSRFVMAAEFVQSTGPLEAVPRRVTIRRADQHRAYNEYLRKFQAALNKLAPFRAQEG
jgi:hypothetical protein